MNTHTNMNTQQIKIKATQSNNSKKEYSYPCLEKLGSIEEITGGPNNGAIDGLFGGNGGFQTPNPTVS